MHKLVLLLAVTFTAGFVLPHPPAAEDQGKPVVLQRDEGEVRTRRPRELTAPTKDFMLKIEPRTNGSRHLVLGTEEIAPGGVIPRHKHLGQDEILLIQTGTAQILLGDKEYEGRAGAVVFIPAQTWISLKNTGKDVISLVFVFNEPGFEEMLRCTSVPKGQPAPFMSAAEVRECTHRGHVEYEALEGKK